MRGKESWENERGEREREWGEKEREWGSGRKRKIKWVERVSERERENRTIEEKNGTVGEKLEEKKCGKEKVGERERGREREKKLCVLEGEKIVTKREVGRVGRRMHIWEEIERVRGREQEKGRKW